MKMATWWTRFKYKYLGRSSTSTLAIIGGALIATFLLARWLTQDPNKYGVVTYIKDSAHEGEIMPQLEINSFMKAMLDTRPQFCHGRLYGSLTPDKASIILDYNEEQFFDIKLTLHSILEHAPQHLVQDIILLDDGSVKESVRKHAMTYLQDPKFQKVKVFRSEEAQGPSLSRFKASKMASGSILVFVSSSVVTNVGWLEPLMEAIQTDRRIIAVPHHDNLLPGQRFYKAENNIVNMFGWTLSTVHFESIDEGDKLLATPAMRGDVFAVDAHYFSTVGSYDDGMDAGGGHNLELSLRAWMCGGGLYVVPCSRVAIHSAYKPIQVNSARNFRRIAELWLDMYKVHAYHVGTVSSDMTTSERHSLDIRKAYLRKSVTCKNFNWYLNNVAQDLIVPSDKVALFGKVKSATGHCLRSLSDESEAVDLVLCRPHVYDISMIFEMDIEGRILMGERCLQEDSKGNVVLLECNDRDSQQQWMFNKENQIVSKEVRSKCITQIPDAYYIKLDICDQSRYQTWTFIKY